MPTSLNVKQFTSPEEAPDYKEINKESGEEKFKAVDWTDAYIVRNGTESGRSTVDLILKDKDGNQYIAMITGRLICSLAKVIGEE